MSDHEDYREGFKQGYQSIKGSAVAVPACPAMTAPPAGKTAFQVGIQAGIAAAKR